MRTAKARILEEIKSTKSDLNPLLYYSIKGIEYQNKKEQFIQVLNSIGGNTIAVSNVNEIDNYINDSISNGKKVIDHSKNDKPKYSLSEIYAADLLIVRGGVAVAENAAIWVDEINMGNRLLPFACEELVLVINEKNIVHNMHQAYELIDISSVGYGVFIAGPSKTADIEQSLVIGAHGPIKFTVFLLIEENKSNTYV